MISRGSSSSRYNLLKQQSANSRACVWIEMGASSSRSFRDAIEALSTTEVSPEDHDFWCVRAMCAPLPHAPVGPC